MLSGSHDQQPASLNEDLKQAHEYVRHIFQLFLFWFGFFATVNYGAIGWLFQTGHSSSIARIIPAFFIAQNVLAIAGTIAVWKGLDRQMTLPAQLGGADSVVPRKLLQMDAHPIRWRASAYDRRLDRHRVESVSRVPLTA